MKRRAFITLLGGAAAWPLVARAQQPRPVIGFLRSTTSGHDPQSIAAFRQGLRGAGYVVGENVTLTFRDADNQYERLPALALDLLREQAEVIVTSGAVSAVMAAKSATKAVPIVFIIGTDPVEHDLVASFNRPGGNITGVTLFSAPLLAKRLGLLREIVPTNAIGFLVNPANPNAARETDELRKLAETGGFSLNVITVGNEQQLEDAVTLFANMRIGAFLYSTDAFFANNQARMAVLAREHAIPGMYTRRDAVAAGGLVSYGADPVDVYRIAAAYVGRILKGAKPSELPVQLPTKYQLIINLNTAKVLGLDIPPTLLASADEVIE